MSKTLFFAALLFVGSTVRASDLDLVVAVPSEDPDGIEVFVSSVAGNNEMKVVAEEIADENKNEKKIVVAKPKETEGAPPWTQIGINMTFDTGNHVLENNTQAPGIFIVPVLVGNVFGFGGEVTGLREAVQLGVNMRGGLKADFVFKPLTQLGIKPDFKIQPMVTYSYYRVRGHRYKTQESGDLKTRQVTGIFGGVSVSFKKFEFYTLVGKPNWKDEVYDDAYSSTTTRTSRKNTTVMVGVSIYGFKLGRK